jgi:hypothetical protein
MLPMNQSTDSTPEPKQNLSQPEANEGEPGSNRRDLARKLGRFAAYAAPITMLLAADKPSATRRRSIRSEP